MVSYVDFTFRYLLKISVEGQNYLDESTLLRDTLYILQGISGKFVKFVGSEDETVAPRVVFTDDAVSHARETSTVIYSILLMAAGPHITPDPETYNPPI